MSEKKTDRRDFLKYLGAGVAGLAVGGAAGYFAMPPKIEKVPVKPEPKKVPTTPIKIGHLDSLTGAAAFWGEPQAKGTRLVVDELNAAGGIMGRKLELVIRDDEGKAATAVEMVKKLIVEDKCDLVTGCCSSGIALAMAPIVEDLGKTYGVPFVAVDGCTWSLHKEKVFKYYLRWCAPNVWEAVAAAYLTNRYWPKAKRIAHISPDYSYGRDGWAAYMEVLKAFQDIEVVYEGWPPLYIKDYTPHITACLAAKPDVVWSTLWGGDLMTFTTQAAGYGFFKATQFVSAVGGDTYLHMKKEEVPEGILAGPHNYYFLYPPWDKWPLNKWFNEKYWARYKEPPHSGSCGAYWVLHAYKAAVEKACAIKGEWAEKEEILAAMKGIGLDEPAGRRFLRAEDGQAVSYALYGFTKSDPTYPFPILDRMEIIGPEECGPPVGPLDAVKWIRDWAKRK